MVTVVEIRDAPFNPRDAAPPLPTFLRGVVEMVRRELESDPVHAFAKRNRLVRFVSSVRHETAAREFIRTVLLEIAQ